MAQPLPPDLAERAARELAWLVAEGGLAVRLAASMLDHLEAEPVLAADAADQLEGLLGDLAKGVTALVPLLSSLRDHLPESPQ